MYTHLIKATHIIFRARNYTIFLFFHEGHHPDHVLLPDGAVLHGGLHQPVAGLVQEALGWLPVLGGGRVEEVEKAFFMFFTFHLASHVVSHEQVNI